jgi:dTDP-4-dehydrorhamnose 3,5-epimerase
MIKPLIIPISIHKDERGELRYCNEFDLSSFKRFYSIGFGASDQIRAWQAHKIEMKSIIPIQGITKVVLVRIADFDNRIASEVYEFTLDSKIPEVLLVPRGYANGFQSKTVDASMMIFSNLSVEKSKNDDFRFEKDEFYNWR